MDAASFCVPSTPLRLTQKIQQTARLPFDRRAAVAFLIILKEEILIHKTSITSSNDWSVVTTNGASPFL